MLAIVMTSIYVLLMVSVGIWGMRRTKTLNDFFLGGRTLGPWVSAIAYGTTYFSAVLFIGFAGSLGWKFGINALWIAAGNVIVGSLLAWKLLGRRTRRMTQNLDTMTMPEFFAERYNMPLLKPLAALIIFVFLIPYSASVYKGLGYLFEKSMGIPFDTALILMTVLTGIYLVMGGYFAVAVTDFIQGIIMVGGAILMVVFLSHTAPHDAAVPLTTSIQQQYHQHVATHAPWYILPCLVFMTSFGVWGMPQMTQKFYAIKNEKVITVATIVVTLFAAIIVFSAYFTGALTHLFYTPQTMPMANGKPVFDQLIPDMMTQHLPPWLSAIILLLILSASMSTLSSLVLVASSTIAIDLYKGHISPDVSSKTSVTMMRFLSAIFIALSFFIARYRIEVIITLMSISWGAIAGAFIAPYLYGLWWKRANAVGALAGMLSGLAASIYLYFFYFHRNESMGPVTATLSILIPLVVMPVACWLSKPTDADVVKKSFEGI